VNTPFGGVNRVGSESPPGDGKWGQADLSGNLSEYLLDVEPTGSLSYPDPCTDYANLIAGTGRAFRGGSWFSNDVRVRVGLRGFAATNVRFDQIGVRCARAL
jgi:formylglycine-generating enzyme required for sulfatase activity